MIDYRPSFKSRISYSVQNEDYQTEMAVLRHMPLNSSQQVLLIASSGETALTLLTLPAVAHVYAVDMNPAQLHLCDLRRAAAMSLPQDQQLRLLGAESFPPGSDSAQRLSLYDQVRLDLNPDSRLFWDEGRDREIAFGIQHVGRNDVGMHDLRIRLREAGFDPLQQSLQDSDLP
ncbi:MAG: DUF3419 family protein, partial [Anaerolineae bacterium]|nr:DUF3419 family protein [Anaerolineae bacterium]